MGIPLFHHSGDDAIKHHVGLCMIPRGKNFIAHAWDFSCCVLLRKGLNLLVARPRVPDNGKVEGERFSLASLHPFDWTASLVELVLFDVLLGESPLPTHYGREGASLVLSRTAATPSPPLLGVNSSPCSRPCVCGLSHPSFTEWD